MEGYKLLAATELGLDYIVLTLFYREGYVDYNISPSGDPRPKPLYQPQGYERVLEKGGSYRSCYER